MSERRNKNEKIYKKFRLCAVAHGDYVVFMYFRFMR